MSTKTLPILLAVLTLVFIVSCVALTSPSPTPVVEATIPPVTEPTDEPPPPPSPTPVTEPTAEPPPPPSPTPAPELVAITVYFTDVNRYAAAIEPYEVAVTRMVPASSNLPEAVLRAFFEGPTPEESAQGLEAITSGFTGLASLVIENGIARVYYTGQCGSMGATYTIAQPTMLNLLQFPEVSSVKIYDENGETEVPDGSSSSIPFCLEP